MSLLLENILSTSVPCCTSGCLIQWINIFFWNVYKCNNSVNWWVMQWTRHLESLTCCNFFQDYLPNMLNFSKRKVLFCHLAICPGGITYSLEPLEILNTCLHSYFLVEMVVDRIIITNIYYHPTHNTMIIPTPPNVIILSKE